MRKKLLIYLVLAALALTACGGDEKQTVTGKSESGYNPGVDDQPFWSDTAGAVLTEYGYYFMIDEILYLYDPQSRQITPVCGRTDCAHGQTDECNASFSDFIDCLNYYNGYLYMIKQEMSGEVWLYRTAPDGSERKKLCRLGLLDDDEGGFSFMNAVHRGYFYYAIVDSQKVPVYRTMSAYRISLEDGKYEKEEIFQREGTDPFIIGFDAYNDTVLFGSSVAGGNSDETVTRYSFYDTASGTVTDIVEGQDTDTGILFARDDNIYYAKERDVFRYSIKDGSCEKIKEKFFGEELPFVSFDGENMYCTQMFSGEITVFDPMDFSEKKTIRVGEKWDLLFGDSRFLFAIDSENSLLQVYDKTKGDSWESVRYGFEEE